MTKSTLLKSGSWYTFRRDTNTVTGRVSYSVKLSPLFLLKSEVAEMQAHFGPASSEHGLYVSKWKFKNKQAAEQALMMGILKFGA